MLVLNFYTRQKLGDTVLVRRKGEIMALDRGALEAALSYDTRPTIEVEKGDMLPDFVKSPLPQRVEVPPSVLAAATSFVASLSGPGSATKQRGRRQ